MLVGVIICLIEQNPKRIYGCTVCTPCDSSGATVLVRLYVNTCLARSFQVVSNLCCPIYGTAPCHIDRALPAGLLEPALNTHRTHRQDK